MALVKIDRDMLLTDLYKLRSLIEADNQEARHQLADLVVIVSNAQPIGDGKDNYPRMRTSR